jgi:hypothetical protein
LREGLAPEGAAENKGAGREAQRCQRNETEAQEHRRAQSP